MSDSTQQEQSEAIRRMHGVLTGALPLMPVLPLVATTALWSRFGGWQLACWLTAALLAPGLRYILVRRFPQSVMDYTSAVRWANEITVSSLLDGMAWGLAGILFLPADSPALQMLLLTMIVGTSAGSVFVTSFWPRTEYAFAVPSVGLTALGLAFQGGEGGWGMAAGLTAFLGILHGITVQAHAATMETIRLRFEKDALLADLRHQKDRAEQASLDKTRFLAAASHDLRQPLHALSLLATALQQRVAGTNLAPLAKRMQAGVGALEGLLNALLDVSRLDAGVVRVQRTSLSLHELAMRLEGEFSSQAHAKYLAWRCEGPAVAVDTDPSLFETVLRNLLTNAVRYTRAGEVALLWRVEGTQVRVVVSDTGVGIAAEHQEAVFREFLQLHNPERDRSKGLGLGLAIVRRLVKLLDHPLTLRSTPGLGSHFELILPLANRSCQKMQAGSNEEDCASPDSASGSHVLVIDDEIAVREAMGLLLADWGYRTTLAASAEDALARLSTAPQAIVVDWRLRDDQTGADAVAQVRASWGAGIPALIVTGDTAPDRLRDATASGHPVLHKPVSPARLRAFLRRATRMEHVAD